MTSTQATAIIKLIRWPSDKRPLRAEIHQSPSGGVVAHIDDHHHRATGVFMTADGALRAACIDWAAHQPASPERHDMAAQDIAQLTRN